MTPSSSPRGRVLLTGATGYVGGRLIRPLREAGWRLRCMARHPDHLGERVEAGTEVVYGDVLEPESLEAALRDVDVAYYLVHSMGDTGDFEEKEKRAAHHFAEAAAAAGVQRIVYLGGLGHGDDLSRHLDSRQEVGRVLRESAVPTVELRASIIIGSGSLSFEMIRTLVNRLPVMITPRWVRTPTQPIAIEDVVDYLVESAEVPLDESRIFEVGGTDVVSYSELMREYARQRGLRRLMVPVPVLTPGLSSLWLGLVSPLYARIGKKLITSIRNETVVQDDGADEAFSVRPRGVVEAISRAMANEDAEYAETRWSDALSSKGSLQGWGGVRFGARLLDSREARVPAPPRDAFRPIQRIGGSRGWYYADWLWQVRGFLDLLAGGVGVRRGRRHPVVLHVGDTVDWWRVERIEPGRLLRLSAEMKVPGRAWLQFEVDPDPGGSRIRQTAVFDPAGLGGLLYWYGIYPIHALVFRGMLRNLAARAAAGERGSDLPDPDSTTGGPSVPMDAS